MEDKALSPREEQIVQLAVEGHTNEGIALALGLSLSTVNTYWVRIRMKIQGESRTAVVVKVIRDKADLALRASNLEKAELSQEIAKKQAGLVDLRAALSLLQLAMDQLRSAVWATDRDLRVSIIANGEIPHFHRDMDWDIGKTIFEVFRTKDQEHPVVAAHLSALRDVPIETRLSINGSTLLLSVRALKEDDGSVIGCIGVMNLIRSDT